MEIKTYPMKVVEGKVYAEVTLRDVVERTKDLSDTPILAEIKRLYDENDRLRELVARLIACVDTISNSDTFYYQPRRDGCGIDCTANGEHCSLIKMCDQARKLGIEVG